MHHSRFESFLWGLVLLVALLGVTLALSLAYPTLRHPYPLPELKLVLATIFMLAGGLVALLSATRFAVEGRRFDLVVCTGFFLTSASWLAFSVVPSIPATGARRTELWAALIGRMLGWGVIAAAPFVGGRIQRRKFVLANAFAAAIGCLLIVWGVTHSLGPALPNLGTDSNLSVPASLIAVLTAQSFLNLLAVIGFAIHLRSTGEDLDRWLALGATLMLFSSLHFLFTPFLHAGDVSQGDWLRLLAYGVLLVGVWRTIRNSEFGRAVAEERARVARDIHDGLAQYLFAISTHASMLENGADLATTLPGLKEAALAAQQEARYAILALSSASGRAPFDAALRRYVDFLTADGVLEVELEIDPAIKLGPDEQIELFRIVQEGLANARKHAGACHAWVQIGERSGERFVALRDDGSGFDAEAGSGGLGLRNMRERAASIGGALTLSSSPDTGTALEVLLRA